MLIFLNIFIICCMFVIGSLFGSFFSLATYRLPRHQDIVATRSYCTSCKHKLGFFNLIPIFSYIFQGGKCSFCNEKISIRYFLLEVVNGVLFVLSYLIFGYTVELLVFCISYAVIFVIIGSMIMKNKMSVEEKSGLKKGEMYKKSGVFVSELTIAMLLFITMLVTAIILNKNYTKSSTLELLKSGAHILAIKNLEMCIATEYDYVLPYEKDEILNSTVYKVSVNVKKVNDDDFLKEDLVKKIDVNVSFNYLGDMQNVNISTLKGKV